MLEAKMLKNNLDNGTFYHYDIMHDGKYFYAWFLKEQNVISAMEEEVKNGKDNRGQGVREV